MGIYIEIFMIGVGLSMDAFAVSICKGLGMKKVDKLYALVIGLFFGGFQALMPFTGWLLGSRFEKYIQNADHWIAFLLLAVIGGKMIVDVIREKDDDVGNDGGAVRIDVKELLVLAVATSIDALAVGITFAFLSYPVFQAVSIIGVTTFVISISGVYIGNIFGSRYKNGAGIAGGIILLLIGFKILFEHLGLISF